MIAGIILFSGAVLFIGGLIFALTAYTRLDARLFGYKVFCQDCIFYKGQGKCKNLSVAKTKNFFSHRQIIKMGNAQIQNKNNNCFHYSIGAY